MLLLCIGIAILFIIMLLLCIGIAILNAQTGDRIWWQWTPKEMAKAFAIQQLESCLSLSAKDNRDHKCEGIVRVYLSSCRLNC